VYPWRHMGKTLSRYNTRIIFLMMNNGLLDSKIKLSYVIISTTGILITLYLLLTRSNLPLSVIFLIFGGILLVSIALWYGIVYPLSKEKD